MAGGSGSVRMAVLLVAITVMLHSAQEVFGISGKEVEAMIIDNCETYKKNSQKHPEHTSIDCQAFLKAFKLAFVNKDPTKMTPEVFNPLMDKFKLPEHKDKYLFWSGPQEPTIDPTTYFYIITESVFSFVNVDVDVDRWCGKKGSDEIIIGNDCPEYKNPASAEKSYWKAASRAFAQAATGKVTVLLNDKVHYDPTRIFAADELPNLNSKKVTELHVLMAITSNNRACNHPSLNFLKNTAQKIFGTLNGKYFCRQIETSKINNIPPEKWWDEATPQ